jgi:3-oxoacyl-[acyl-carrier protein] reductase
MSEIGTAIVTGGSAGIGAAIVAALLDHGYTVISFDLKPPAAPHPRLEPIIVDLLDPAATRAAAAAAVARHQVTHCVHNAGAIRPNPIEAAEVSDLQALAQLHLGAALILLQAALPRMKERRFGRIVLISSRAALGAPGRTAYSATKSGMIGMGRAWALELAPYGITVNLVAPGPIHGTDMFHAVIPPESEREAALAKSIPVGRLGHPQDVTRAVLFFAAPEASFVTGQVLYVCGGSSLGALAI